MCLLAHARNTPSNSAAYGATRQSHARPATRSPSPAQPRRAVPSSTVGPSTAPQRRASPAPRRAPSPRGRFDPTQYVEDKRRQQQEAQQRLRMHPSQRSGARQVRSTHLECMRCTSSGASSPAMSRASSWSSTQRQSPRYLQPIGHVRGSPRVSGWHSAGPSPSRAPLHTLSSAERNIADIDSRLHALQDFLRAAASSRPQERRRDVC